MLKTVPNCWKVWVAAGSLSNFLVNAGIAGGRVSDYYNYYYCC